MCATALIRIEPKFFCRTFLSTNSYLVCISIKRAARLLVLPRGYIGRRKRDSFGYEKTSQRYRIKLGKLDFLYFVGSLDGLLPKFLQDDENLLRYKVKALRLKVFREPHVRGEM